MPVASDRLGGVPSEVVVQAHDLRLRHPAGVREVRRLLLEHADPLALPAR